MSKVLASVLLWDLTALGGNISTGSKAKPVLNVRLSGPAKSQLGAHHRHRVCQWQLFCNLKVFRYDAYNTHPTVASALSASWTFFTHTLYHSPLGSLLAPRTQGRMRSPLIGAAAAIFMLRPALAAKSPVPVSFGYNKALNFTLDDVRPLPPFSAPLTSPN